MRVCNPDCFPRSSFQVYFPPDEDSNVKADKNAEEAPNYRHLAATNALNFYTAVYRSYCD